MNNNLYTPEKMIQIEYTKHTQNYDMGRFHYHNAYELLLLQEGEYTPITLDNACTLKKHDVSLITPYCMHKSLGRAGNERTLMYFDERYLNRYFTEKSRSLLLTCFQTGHLSLPQKHYEETLQLLFQIRSFSAKKDFDSTYPAFVRILSLLTQTYRQAAGAEEETQKTSAPLIAELITYINQNYSTIRSLDDIADHFYITKWSPSRNTSTRQCGIRAAISLVWLARTMSCSPTMISVGMVRRARSSMPTP